MSHVARHAANFAAILFGLTAAVAGVIMFAGL
jgi:hypothetical protein